MSSKIVRLWPLGCIFLLGCTDLPDIEKGACGNGIVEGGEDCDSKDASCVQKDEPNECRYDCSLVGDTRRECPTGYHCGAADNVCRKASGEFGLIATAGSAESLYVTSGDFDADGRDDVLSMELDRFVVHFAGATGRLESSVETRVQVPSEPALGRMTGDPLDSIALPLGELSVYNGAKDRTIEPKAYSPYQVAPGTLDTMIIDALPFDPLVGNFFRVGCEVVALTTPDNLQGKTMLFDVGQNQIVYMIDFDLSQPHAPFPHADLNAFVDANQNVVPNGDEFVVAMPGKKFVDVYGLSRWDDSNQTYVWDKNGQQPATVTSVALPPSHQLADYDDETLPSLTLQKDDAVGYPPLVVLTDVNGDKHIDMVAMSYTDPAGELKRHLLVAYSDGKGDFYATPSFTTGLNQFGILNPEYEARLEEKRIQKAQGFNGGTFAEGFPLAIADLNEDGWIDVVATDGINLSRPNVVTTVSDHDWYGALPKQWISAAVANANGDQHLDVYAIGGARNVELVVGTGTNFFNQVTLPTAGYVRQITIGDYDGNLIDDAAFFESSLVAGTNSFGVLFGRAHAAPATPETFATFYRILGMGSGHVGFGASGFDRVSDIGLLAKNTSHEVSAALFPGSTDGQLQSPFNLILNDASAFAQRAILGKFDESGHDGIVVVTGPPKGFDFSLDLDLDFRAWYLPVTGEAELDVATVKSSSAFDSRFAACNALFGAVDLDRDGLDEIVAFGPHFETSYGPPTGGAMQVIRVKDGIEPDAATLTPVPEWYTSPATSIDCNQPDAVAFGGKGSESGQPDIPTFPGQLAVGNVGGDELADVVVLGLGLGELEPSTGASPSMIAVWLNEGTGSLDKDKRRLLRLKPRVAEDGKGEIVQMILTFALVQADADPELEIVYVVGEFANTTRPVAVYLADLDLEKQEFANERLLENVAADYSAAAADVNGDGVTDLILGGQAGVNIYQGIEVKP